MQKIRVLPLTVGLVGVVLCLGCGPEVRWLYIGPGEPVARPDTARVDVFLRSAPPQRPYAVIGEVEVTTDRNRLLLRPLLAEARELGGDAVILETSSTPTTQVGSAVNPYTGLSSVYSHTGTRRVMKGVVIVWK